MNTQYPVFHPNGKETEASSYRALTKGAKEVAKVRKYDKSNVFYIKKNTLRQSSGAAFGPQSLRVLL